MRRRLNVFLYGHPVGILSQDENGYLFEYHDGYHGPALSLSLPVSKRRFPRQVLHPFFASLAPEGWLKERYCQLQKIDENDVLSLLANNGINMLGAVQISAEE